MPATLLAIITGHLLGDFALPAASLATERTKVPVLALHAGIVALTTALLLGNFHLLILPAIFAAHLVFDQIKSRIGDTIVPFLLHQLAHFTVAVILAYSFPNASAQGWWPGVWQTWLPQYHAVLCLTAGFILVVPAGGILIGKLTTPLRAEIEESRIVIDQQPTRTAEDAGGDYLTEGLNNGGMYIGWLERFLTMMFILIGQPTGIGFLIAAKSILRFGEIKDSKHRKLAEYIIIGTFLSFGWALMISVLMRMTIGYFIPAETVEQIPW